VSTIEAPSWILQAVRELAPIISERADEIEAARMMPADLHQQLKEAGVYRILVPRSHGGEHLDLHEVLEIIEELSVADGSIGWTATIGIQSPCLLSLLPRETFDDIYADGPDVTLGGSFVPAGELELTRDGYRISGKWPFASGCDNWDWIMATGVVKENGEPLPGPREGQPLTRSVVLRREQVELLDTWYTLGLRGTGSKHFVIDDEFVPTSHTLDVFYGHPCVEGIYQYPIIEFTHHIASISIGIAQGALNELIASATSRRRYSARNTLAEMPAIQHRIGRADTSLRAARKLMHDQAERLLTGQAGEDFLELMVWAWSNNAYTAQTCVEVVDTCFRAYGAQGIYDGSPLQRRLRDIYTIVQHASLNDASLTRAGAALFGQEVGPWF
jgi:alkylation response protein AidB-like acyl-CoA dehydrogenase